jgi:iron-sulfur cluster assembly protein
MNAEAPIHVSPAPVVPARRELPPLMRLSEAAAERLRGLYARPNAKKFIRIAVKTKGCSGLSYDLTFVDEAGPGDEVVRDQGLTLLVDRKASLFLFGTVMDFRREQFSEGFTFQNPNEKGRCGCGESFHV